MRPSIRRTRHSTRILLAAAITFAVAVPLACSRNDDGPPPFIAFSDRYFDALYAFSPTAGTAAGFHQYDDKLEDLSAAAINARIGQLRTQIDELEDIRATQLIADDSIDAAMLNGAIRSELQELTVIQSWKKNPMLYAGIPGYAVDFLMKRNFAPPLDRLKAVTARLRRVPAVLAAMRTNVENPPKEFADLAQRITAGSVGFFKNDVALWAKASAGTDTVALKAFTAANDSVIVALESASAWITSDLLPRSKGTYAIGAQTFADKLAYDEMIDIPLDRLLALGEANLAKDHADFVATAAKVAPGKSPAEAMAVLEREHPNAAGLLAATKSTIEGARKFLVDKQIVDIPSDVRPTVMETPPFARNGSFASMDTPGAYEKKATEAFYYVTPPEKEWDAKHTEEHLRLFNKSVMELITIHEGFPGHFLQFIYAPQFPTRTRKLLGVGSNAEGWAHYAEQMMLDEGFGNGDPKIKLAQLSEALLRDCRWVVGIRLHTQGLTVEEGAKKYFTEQCFQQPANAYEESRRGAYNPTYLYYTFGKLAIYKLRADYQAAKGSAYSLKEFHNEFVKQGALPLKLMRRLLLPGDKGTVL
jgi:uncharacterized protein (DUF885 family)